MYPSKLSQLHAILEQLADYVIDGEEAALDAACLQLADSAEALEVNALMQGLSALKGSRADPIRIALAERRLRGVLGLPMHAGAICRPNTLN